VAPTAPVEIHVLEQEVIVVLFQRIRHVDAAPALRVAACDGALHVAAGDGGETMLDRAALVVCSGRGGRSSCPWHGGSLATDGPRAHGKASGRRGHAPVTHAGTGLYC